jgi:hypothetical protein
MHLHTARFARAAPHETATHKPVGTDVLDGPHFAPRNAKTTPKTGFEPVLGVVYLFLAQMRLKPRF